MEKYISYGNGKHNIIPLSVLQTDVDIDALFMAIAMVGKENKIKYGYYHSFIYFALQNGYYGKKYNKITNTTYLERLLNEGMDMPSPQTFSEYKRYCEWDKDEQKIRINKPINATKYEIVANTIIDEVKNNYNEIQKRGFHKNVM